MWYSYHVQKITMEYFLILILMATVMEIVDSSIGMMYGTLLAPLLVSLGFDPIVAVPALLLSQAVGGIGGSLSHQKFRNADFRGWTKDIKVALAMIIPGLAVVFLGVFIAVSISQFYVKLYIAVLVLVMSILCLTGTNYTFAWWKHVLVGTLAAFNKALSGGGFGPVTSTGGIIGGLTARVSIATTTLAEVFICSASVIIYLFYTNLDYKLAMVLSIGAVVGGSVGPYISSRVNHRILRIVVAVVGLLSGVWLMGRLL